MPVEAPVTTASGRADAGMAGHSSGGVGNRPGPGEFRSGPAASPLPSARLPAGPGCKSGRSQPMSARYLPYGDDVEHVRPGEDETAREIIATMRRITETGLDRYRHALRPSHAKSH